MLGFFDDFGHILLVVVVLVVAFGLTERWRIEHQAQKKRERQNRTKPTDV
jgi:putative copper export protein